MHYAKPEMLGYEFGYEVMNLQQERNEDQRDRPADIALLEDQVLHRQRFCGRLGTSM